MMVGQASPVLLHLSHGEVDAALVYVTDVTAAGEEVEGIEVPEADQAINKYPISLLADAADADLAQAFIDFVSSADGLKVFTDAGFGTP